MRRAAKVDDNQAEIVAGLRAVGATVQSLAATGEGCPDLCIGMRDGSGVKRNWLIEVKDGAKPPSARKLTPAQVEWHDAWRGQVDVAKDLDEALDIIGAKVTF